MAGSLMICSSVAQIRSLSRAGPERPVPGTLHTDMASRRQRSPKDDGHRSDGRSHSRWHRTHRPGSRTRQGPRAQPQRRILAASRSFPQGLSITVTTPAGIACRNHAPRSSADSARALLPAGPSRVDQVARNAASWTGTGARAVRCHTGHRAGPCWCRIVARAMVWLSISRPSGVPGAAGGSAAD
jgi:hypothetical protein